MMNVSVCLPNIRWVARSAMHTSGMHDSTRIRIRSAAFLLLVMLQDALEKSTQGWKAKAANLMGQTAQVDEMKKRQAFWSNFRPEERI